MEKEKPKSFRLSRETMFDNTIYGDMSKKDWWKFKKVSYKINYGIIAILFIGYGLLVPVLLPIGIIAGIIWLSQPREVVVASGKLKLEEIKKFLGETANNLTNEEVIKRFTELPTEKQMEAVFWYSPQELKRQRNIKIIVGIIALISLFILPLLLLPLSK